MILTPTRDPISGAYFCALACPLPYRTEAAAAACDHRPPVPYVPGDPDMRRPTYVPATAKRAPSGPVTYRPWRPRWYHLLALVLGLMMALSALLVVAGAYADTHPRPGPVVTPTTYGPPGPRGGPVAA